MCDNLILPEPLQSVESFLDSWILPSVQDVSINDKRGIDPKYSSFGISLTLKQNMLNPGDFKDEEILFPELSKNTIGLLPDQILFETLQSPNKDLFFKNVERIPRTPNNAHVILSDDSKYEEENKKYPTPLVKTFHYPAEVCRIFFNVLRIRLSAESISASDIGEFLFYRSVFMRMKFPTPGGNLESRKIEFDSYSLYFQKFLFKFLQKSSLKVIQ